MNLPFLEKSTKEDGSVVFSSVTTGLVIVESDPSDHDRLVAFQAPGFTGHDEYQVLLQKGSSVEAEYADHWLRWISVSIGLGFHPDTPSDEYTPPLSEPLKSEYDAMISYCFEHLDNPYQVGMKAWESAGMLEVEITNGM